MEESPLRNLNYPSHERCDDEEDTLLLLQRNDPKIDALGIATEDEDWARPHDDDWGRTGESIGDNE